MADFPFIPLQGDFKLISEEPPTLESTFEDGTIVRREKRTTAPRQWQMTLYLDATDIATFRTFWLARRLATTFTQITYDPNDAPAGEANVKFLERPTISFRGPDWHVVRLSTIEALA
ncbi:MAG: hypothetical protein GY715_14275 [Planctomycetes bacterium]|nr:hypothetical protein [Planctomycetota bacterium]